LERALGQFLFKKKNASKCLVFCNSVASCRSTHHVLGEKFSDVCEAFCLHGEMRQMQREESWKSFVSNQDDKKKVLVCTDLSSRGLDVSEVSNVVIFDIPNSLPDLIHRAGRTGRAGREGNVTFVVGRGEKHAVMQLLNSRN
jgi:ATP-dependent RNA helicase DDX5/DBP2